MKQNKIKAFYDLFTTQQVKTDINRRHNHIAEGLVRFGLQRSHNVLEIGCGIGTLTGLIAQILKTGCLVANDLSDKSIRIARERLKNFSNIDYIAGDFLEISINKKFDVVVLPDVLEHIPIEKHSKLFSKISKILNQGGFIYINVPNPFYLEWCIQRKPEVLQIIDQPIHTDALSKSIYKHELFIYHLETHSQWVNNDYQTIVLKLIRDQTQFEILSYKKTSLYKRIVFRLNSIFNG